MRSFFSILIGIIVIALGVTLILDNFDVMPFNTQQLWLIIYPSFFVLYGGKLMVDRMRRKGGNWVIGSFLFILGALLLLGRFDVITFAFKDIYKLWPMFIIYIGFGILGSFRRRKRIIYTDFWEVNNDDTKKQEANQKNNSDANFDSHQQAYSRTKNGKHYDRTGFFSVGDYTYADENWRARPLHLKSMAGDFYFDFTRAFIPEEEIPIRIRGQAGDIHIIVPKNIPFRIHAAVKAGEIVIDGQETSGINRSVTYEIDDYADAVKKLDFDLSLSAGAIRIDRV